MIESLVYFLLAALGLGFLIFIHELGHYFMARRVGMRVEAFGIGFGKPIYSWERHGVKWNICWLPFGGYVKIAGMEKEGTIEPSQIPDGFFGKPPLDRIKVALMGPVVNIIFAFVIFVLIWGTGGREKPFQEYTHLVGWVDPGSALYEKGVRPGDSIASYDNRPFDGFNDLLLSSLLDEKKVQIGGEKINYLKDSEEPFNYTLETYPDPRAANSEIHTIGVFSPARYLIFDNAYSLPEGSPMLSSGIQNGDRVLWVDGELVFSMQQLSHIVNEPKVLLTVERQGDYFLTRIPRLKVGDICFKEQQREEIDDWQHEADLKAKVPQLYFIPYNLNHETVVEGEISYLDERSEETVFTRTSRSPAEKAILAGDRIVAVDGQPVNNASELLSALQQRRVSMIVERKHLFEPISWKIADQEFYHSVSWENLKQITSFIGTGRLIKESGNLVLLNPITPKPINQFNFYTEKKQWYAEQQSEKKKLIEEKIKNPQEKAQALRFLEESQSRLALGIQSFEDRLVRYNPSPVSLFEGVFDQMWRTIKALVMGSLSPKWMSGPVGIVQVFHHGWSLGVKEALFWMAVISLNLGVLNLLPLPVLDGGHILFALIEKITRKPIKAKTMERLFIPFIFLLVAAFVYFTYNDLVRLFSHFF